MKYSLKKISQRTGKRRAKALGVTARKTSIRWRFGTIDSMTEFELPVDLSNTAKQHATIKAWVKGMSFPVLTPPVRHVMDGMLDRITADDIRPKGERIRLEEYKVKPFDYLTDMAIRTRARMRIPYVEPDFFLWWGKDSEMRDGVLTLTRSKVPPLHDTLLVTPEGTTNMKDSIFKAIAHSWTAFTLKDNPRNSPITDQASCTLPERLPLVGLQFDHPEAEPEQVGLPALNLMVGVGAQTSHLQPTLTALRASIDNALWWRDFFQSLGLWDPSMSYLAVIDSMAEIEELGIDTKDPLPPEPEL